MEKTPLRFIWHYIKIFKWAFLLIGFLNFVSAVCENIAPYYLSKMFDLIAGKLQNDDLWNEIWFCLGATLIFRLLMSVFMDVAMFVYAKIQPNMRTMIIRDCFNYINKHSISFFTNEMSGNIATKVSQIQSGIVELFHHTFNLHMGLMNFIIIICTLTYLSTYFLAILLIWATATIWFGKYLGAKRAAYAKETASQQSKAQGMIVDSLANYSEIKSFANFKFEHLNLLKALRLLRKTESKEERTKVAIHTLQSVLVVVSVAMFMIFSLLILKEGKISSVEFIFSNTIFARLSYMIFQISWMYNALQRIFGQMTSALNTIAVEPEIVDSPHAIDAKFAQTTIRFDNVCYAYTGKATLFNKLNLTIKAGEKVGLVGCSGSGKSTFIKLLSRFFDVKSGKIMINDIDIRDMTQESLHRMIATIPQDVNLFNRTLRENIRYGRTSATDKEIETAAKKAYADVFINELPKKYETKVGERGVVLSGGERQRIAIARAILKNAPLLIFDEATSALDSESEQHIQKSLSNLMKGKTVIAIAHRLSTLREMDRILVFDKGKIVEEGTHLSLLRKKGVYYKLYNMQADGFVKE